MLRKLEWLLLAACIFVTVSKWLAAGLYSPDSVYYITAAQGFLKTHAFSVQTFQLTEPPLPPIPLHYAPYNVYPLGFPALLALFQLLFHHIVTATLVMQSFIFAGLFLSVRFLLERLGLPVLYRLPIYLFLLAFKGYQEDFAYFLTEPLFMTVNVWLLYQAHALLTASQAREVDRRLRAAFALLLICPLIRFNGVFCFLYFAYPCYVQRKILGRAGLRKFIVLMSAAILPTALYLLRNKFVVGSMSTFHGNVGDHISWSNVPYLFTVHFQRLFRSSALLTAAVAAVLAAGKNRTHRLLVLCWLIAVLSIWFLTLISHSEPLGDRYLCVGYLFFIVLLAHSAFSFGGKGKVAAALVPLYFLLNASNFYNPAKNWSLFEVHAPREKALWEHLRADPLYSKADFFVTDYDYVHSVFSDRFQVIVERVPGEAVPWGRFKKWLEAYPRPLRYLTVFDCSSGVQNPSFAQVEKSERFQSFCVSSITASAKSPQNPKNPIKITQ